jgi:fatty-acyl-CoA synthase
MTSGGAAMPVPLIQAWQAVHSVPFKQGFGMTEFGPGLFSMGPEFAISKAGSIGRPNYFVEARLVDDDGREVPVGEVGELVLKGPSMCSGYFNDEAATKEAIDAQGWFHTGDLARRDADGFYTIAGRKKDMFISGGENVYPLELETALYEHPAVQQCAVVGVPDAKWGEVGRAFVVLKPGATATSDELLAHLRDRVARFKVPKKVELMERLPVSPAGKILKRELRQAAIAADARG